MFLTKKKREVFRIVTEILGVKGRNSWGREREIRLGL
jgi:hypothetical protein